MKVHNLIIKFLLYKISPRSHYNLIKFLRKILDNSILLCFESVNFRSIFMFPWLPLVSLGACCVLFNIEKHLRHLAVNSFRCLFWDRLHDDYVWRRGRERKRTQKFCIFLTFFQLDDNGRFFVLITLVEWAIERKSRVNSRFCFGFEETKLSLEKCRLGASREWRKSERAEIN